MSDEDSKGTKLYTLVRLSNLSFELRAPLWEVQAWTKILQGPGGFKNPSFLRLDLLNLEQLKELFKNVTGTESESNDEDELRIQCEILAEQVPVNETGLEELRKRFIEAYPGATEWPAAKQTEGEKQIMSDGTNTAVATDGATATQKQAKAPRPKGAKALVREIYQADANSAFSLEELAAKTGKPTGSITTAISDLRSTKYCKPGDPLNLHRWSDGKYRLQAEPKVEKAPETATTAPADVLPQA